MVFIIKFEVTNTIRYSVRGRGHSCLVDASLATIDLCMVVSPQYCSVILCRHIYHPVRQDIVLCRYVDYFVSDSIIVSAYCLSSEQWIRAVANSWLNKIGRVSLCIYIALYLNLKYKIWKWFFFMIISYYSFYCILLFEIFASF